MSVTQSQMIKLLQICDVRYKNLFEGYIFVEFLERAKGFEYFTHFEFVIVDNKFRENSIETLLNFCG